MTTIGVLTLQGDFIEHQAALRRLNVGVCQVRAGDELRDLEYLGYGRLATTTPGPLGGRPSEVFILREAYGGVAETLDCEPAEGVSATPVS